MAKGGLKTCCPENHIKHKQRKKSGQIPQAPRSPEPSVERPSKSGPLRRVEKEKEKLRERGEREGGRILNPKQMASIGAEHEKH